MIQVTLSFPTIESAIAALREIPSSVVNTTAAKVETKAEAPAKKSAAAATTQATAPAAAAQPEKIPSADQSGTTQPAAAASAQPEGNGVSSAEAPAPTTAPAASAPSPVDFDTLKKAFLALSTKAGGRALCEGVLKPHGLAKLSEAKPEQYAAVLSAIEQAAQ